MTYNTQCLNCGSELFIYDPQDYKFVHLHPQGGITDVSEEIFRDEDGWKKHDTTWLYDSPEQVRCDGCGLEVERVRLDPDFDWNNKLSEFNIKIHD